MEKFIFTCPACGNTTEILIDEKKAQDVALSREVAFSAFSKCTECGEPTKINIEITPISTDDQE
jgi:uncharacterized Zn finger protein